MLRTRAPITVALAATLAGLGACGERHSTPSPPAAQTTNAGRQLPGTGKPPVTIGDKNFTEQFVLGELYAQALRAQGYTITLNRDIGPTEVTIQALYSGRLSMYPEYLNTWISTVAGIKRQFPTRRSAYQAAGRYARAHGLRLLTPTPFSDTSGIAVTRTYAKMHRLRTIGDLGRVASGLTLGAPPQFQQSPDGLPAIQNAYGFVPATFKALAIGTQYTALDSGAVQAADVNTTDGQLIGGRYSLLRDPTRALGWGGVAPVVPERVLKLEGPAFKATINRVSVLLNTATMRKLNAAVDVYKQDPAKVAKRFLLAHGLLRTQ
jgi:osmoprotectant transport system substrate-binding protein